MEKEVVMTLKGLQDAEQKLEYLKTVRRKEISEKIKEARSFGDLSENSEYDEAKNEQALVESEILELETRLKNVRVLEEDDVSGHEVSLGSYIKVKPSVGKTEEYHLVGSAEADAFNGKISDESPVGAALLGKKAGDKVEITLPNGNVVKYKVLAISKDGWDS